MKDTVRISYTEPQASFVARGLSLSDDIALREALTRFPVGTRLTDDDLIPPELSRPMTLADILSTQQAEDGIGHVQALTAGTVAALDDGILVKALGCMRATTSAPQKWDWWCAVRVFDLDRNEGATLWVPSTWTARRLYYPGFERPDGSRKPTPTP